MRTKAFELIHVPALRDTRAYKIKLAILVRQANFQILSQLELTQQLMAAYLVQKPVFKIFQAKQLANHVESECRAAQTGLPASAKTTITIAGIISILLTVIFKTKTSIEVNGVLKMRRNCAKTATKNFV